MRPCIQALAMMWLAAMVGNCHLPCASAQVNNTAQKPNPQPKKPEKKKITLDDLKLPPGAVLILVEELLERMDISDKWLLTKIREYKKDKDRIAELERLLKRETKPAHACKLSAKVENDVVTCEARFTLTTQADDSRVFLGLKGVQFTNEGVLNDDEVPILNQNEKGFDVAIKKPGLHKLTVSFNVPLRLMAQERSFEFGLPGAAVTTLELRAPTNVNALRCNGKTERRSANGTWKLALGTADNLIVSWKHPTAINGVDPLLTATANLDVEIDQAAIHVKSDCVLHDLAGKTKEWKLLLPKQVQIKTAPTKGSAPAIIPPTKSNPFYIVRTESPAAKPIALTLNWTIPRPSKAKSISFGPMRVLGAVQNGSIDVRVKRGVGPTTRYEYKLPNSHEVAASAGTDVAFHYRWSSGETAHPLTVNIYEEKSKLETQFDHKLHVFGTPNGWQVELTTTIQARVLQGNVPFVDVRLPQPSWNGFAVQSIGSTAGGWAALPWGAWSNSGDQAVSLIEPMELETKKPGVEYQWIENGKTARLLILPKIRSFQLRLRGRFIVGPSWLRRMRLALPTPVDTASRSGSVTVLLENTLEFVRSNSLAPLHLDPHKLELSYATPPNFVYLQWKRHRPDLEVSIVSDVTVDQSEVSVRQTLEIPIEKERELAPARKSVRPPIRLVGPKNILSRLRSVSGGRLLRDETSKQVWVVLPKELFDRHQIILDYDFPAPSWDDAADPVLTVPFILPEAATRVNAKTRIWTQRGVLPKLSAETVRQNHWKPQRLEQVAERSTLPSMVLTGIGKKAPLTITLSRPVQLRVPQIVVDRALIQVSAGKNGFHYLARFNVAKVNTQALDVQLPGPVSQTLTGISLDGKGVNHWQIVSGEPNTVRIPLDAVFSTNGFLLAIEYDVSTRQAEVQRWCTTFYAPGFRGEVFVHRLRWQLPMDFQQTFFVPSDEVRTNADWQFHDGLWVPTSTITTSQLETWLTGARIQSDNASSGAVLDASGVSTIRVWRLPRPLWLFLCSGIVLIVGLGLFFAPVSRWTFWIFLMLFGVGTAILIAIWPTLKTAVLFGVQPGVAVLLVFFISYWAWREWHRRKTVFMPGFSRTPHAHSAVHKDGPQSKSTVDAPLPSGVNPAESSSH